MFTLNRVPFISNFSYKPQSRESTPGPQQQQRKPRYATGHLPLFSFLFCTGNPELCVAYYGSFSSSHPHAFSFFYPFTSPVHSHFELSSKFCIHFPCTLYHLVFPVKRLHRVLHETLPLHVTILSLGWLEQGIGTITLVFPTSSPWTCNIDACLSLSRSSFTSQQYCTSHSSFPLFCHNAELVQYATRSLVTNHGMRIKIPHFASPDMTEGPRVPHWTSVAHTF